MDGSCGSVSLDRYWNNVAIPFLFVILGFGLYVLFTLSDIQFTSTKGISSTVGAIAGSMLRSRNTNSQGNAEGGVPTAGKQPTNANIMANLQKGVGK